VAARKDNDLTGRRVGEYEISRRLGAGGMGVVYEGMQPLIGKRVAVKVLLPELSEDPVFVDRFLSEARAVNSIRHRGIVDIFSFGQLEGKEHYFVMEFLDGIGMDQVLKTEGPQDPHRVLGWVSEVADALDAAHAAGIIHRDVKPSNLFLVQAHAREYVKLLDFGIAKIGTAGQAMPQTRVDTVIGTPDYMAPEQVRGEPISAQTDLYALGCVIFELLTGRRPFRGANVMQVMTQHLEDPIPRAADLIPEVPAEVDELVSWLMQKHAGARPARARELMDRAQSVRSRLSPAAPATRRLPPARASATPPPGGRGTKTPLPITRASGDEIAVPQKLLDAVADSGLMPLPAETLLQRAVEISAGQKVTVPSPALGPDVTRRVPHVLEEPTRRKRGPLIIGFLALTVVSGAVAALYAANADLLHGGPKGKIAPPPVAELAPEPAPAVEPVEAKPEEPKPTPVATPEPVKPEEEKPEPATPPATRPHASKSEKSASRASGRHSGRPVSDSEITARLKRLEERLTTREAQMGGRDRVLRQFLSRAHEDAAKAHTAAERQEVWSALDDLQRQLDGG
jgi:serine/threonine-protein kinase